MNLSVVSPFPPEISGIGQYGWHVTHGLARQPSITQIRVLAGGSGRGSTPAPTMAARRVSIEHRWSPDDPRTSLRLVRALRDQRPDVVWFNLGFTVFGRSRPVNFLGMAAPMLARRAGLSTVVTLHELFEATPPLSVGAANGHLTALGARAATRMVLQADAVCTTLRRYVVELRRRYGARNLHHVPHGAFTAPEFLLPPNDCARWSVLIFATFAPYKGLPVLLEALARVRRVIPDATLTIAGRDHPRFPGYLASLRRSLYGMPGVRWLGTQTETQLRTVFASAAVVVLPYIASTGASSVIHRAAAYGRPVVASDLPDMRAVAEEEDLRVQFAPPGDAAGLAAALLHLLRNPQRQQAMARHNFDRMRLMTLDHTCARYVRVFAQAAGQA